MGVVLSVLLDLAGAEAWNRVKARFAAPPPNWQDQVVGRLSADPDLNLTSLEGAAVRAWFARPEVFNVLASSTEDSLEADADRVVAGLQFELGTPSDQVIERAEIIAGHAIAHLAELFDPSVAATLATFRVLKADTEALKEGQRVLLDAIVEIGLQTSVELSRIDLDTATLMTVPVVVAADLEVAQELGASANLLLQTISGGGDVRARLAVVIRQPPIWMASSAMWAAAAFMADALGLSPEAVSAFKQAADADPARQSLLLARAALAAARAPDQAVADELIAEARHGASASDLVFIGIVDAALREDAAAVIAAGRLSEILPGSELVLATNFVGQALTVTGSLDRAVEVYEAGLPWADRQAGYLLSFANTLLARASGDYSSTRTTDATRAMELAIAARDERRRWGGNSAECVAAACKAAFLRMDLEGLIRLADPVGGEATTDEASYTETKQLLALARSAGGDGLPDPSSPFERAWFRGLRLSADPAQRNQAAADLRRAAALAGDDLELDRAQRALANLGVVDLPRIGEVRLRSEDQAETLIALAESVAGNLPSKPSNIPKPTLYLISGKNMNDEEK